MFAYSFIKKREILRLAVLIHNETGTRYIDSINRALEIHQMSWQDFKKLFYEVQG